MKLIKQTVYLPAKVMNKGQKADLKSVVKGIPTPVIRGEEGYFFTPEQLNEYTTNVVRQALETASENADWDCDKHHQNITVNKQSITNTFEETFNKLKV